jgi:MraZ protein
MFRGRYDHTIDPKGRLSVPARFRDVLARYEGPVIVVPNDHALEVHPLPEWEKLEGKISQHPTFSQEVRQIGRLYVSRCREVDLDGAGRILLPPDVREPAALDRDVTLVGPGLPFFEVWDRARFSEYERSNGGGLTSLFDKLAQLGV